MHQTPNASLRKQKHDPKIAVAQYIKKTQPKHQATHTLLKSRTVSSPGTLNASQILKRMYLPDTPYTLHAFTVSRRPIT
ncbi:MAG: hypothetical protein CMM07_03600 [Rhodopirellula sp.]|nr:hypothetical protein [Rhodopirellula sp.]